MLRAERCEMIRNWITAAAWRVFLWGRRMTPGEYLAELDRTYGVLKLCPNCRRPMTLVCRECEEWE